MKNLTILATYGNEEKDEMDFFVDTEWLQKKLDLYDNTPTVEEFKDYYTFDDAEEILIEAKKDKNSNLQF